MTKKYEPINNKAWEKELGYMDLEDEPPIVKAVICKTNP